MAYANYRYYSVVYGGDIPEEAFRPFAERASAYLDSITFGRAPAAIKGTFAPRLKNACCAIADKLYDAHKGELKSESLGSWKRTYRTASRAEDEELYKLAAAYLGLTGLLFRG
ncbi:MAG: hypothetical protein IJC39_05660 [Firmicutes bacterium]|nr:hypothetical protein [Bacillota bacterium]